MKQHHQKSKKEAKKELKTGDIKIPMSLCCKCGWMFGNKPFKITLWGHFKDSKWSLAQNLDFLRCPQLFWP